MLNNTSHGKIGREKIDFCADQAKSHGLAYFWVDTCCINKENKAELTTAINSMFRWYRNAARCYAYLSDVSARCPKDGGPPPRSRWEPAFRASRWFTRGWTLQELLAPSSVEFFSFQGTPLGNKRDLQQLVHENTGIAIRALCGEPLASFSVEERFEWAKYRQTSKAEDYVYSLLGIFGIYLAPIYGEGKENAVQRLLSAINNAHTTEHPCLAALRTTDPRHDKTRIEGDKGGLLDDVYQWVLCTDEFVRWQHNEQDRLLWIKGDPGKGKTMLLCGIINELAERNSVLSYFFC